MGPRKVPQNASPQKSAPKMAQYHKKELPLNGPQKYPKMGLKVHQNGSQKCPKMTPPKSAPKCPKMGPQRSALIWAQKVPQNGPKSQNGPQKGSRNETKDRTPQWAPEWPIYGPRKITSYGQKKAPEWAQKSAPELGPKSAPIWDPKGKGSNMGTNRAPKWNQ